MPVISPYSLVLPVFFFVYLHFTVCILKLLFNRRITSQPQLQGAWNMRNLENAIPPLDLKKSSKLHFDEFIFHRKLFS